MENSMVTCWDSSGFNLRSVTSAMLCKYLGECSVHKRGIHDGEMKSISTAEGHHAAIVNMYKENKIPLPEGFDEVVCSYLNLRLVNSFVGMERIHCWIQESDRKFSAQW
jgi:hypothetical protein